MSKAAEPAAVGDTSGEANLLPLRPPDQNNGLSFRDRRVTADEGAQTAGKCSGTYALDVVIGEKRHRCRAAALRRAPAVQALDAAGARIGNVHKFLLYQCTRPFG